MTYKPQIKTPEEILAASGFKYDNRATRGWVRALSDVLEPDAACIRLRATKKKDPGHRLHALVREGMIDLHLDRNDGGRHYTARNSSFVKKCIREFQKIDV